MATRKRKKAVACAVGGCGVTTPNYCTVTYRIDICQGHAAKLATGRAYLNTVELVEPVLDKIEADQREERGE